MCFRGGGEKNRKSVIGTFLKDLRRLNSCVSYRALITKEVFFQRLTKKSVWIGSIIVFSVRAKIIDIMRLNKWNDKFTEMRRRLYDYFFLLQLPRTIS